MKKIFFSAVAVSLLLVAASPAGSAELPRKALLGVGLKPPPAGTTGVMVDMVLPGATAEKIGIRKGDVIVQLGGKPLEKPADLVAYVSTLTAGSPIDLKVSREGKILRLRGRAMARPKESYSGATVDYGAVPFQGGHLRDILVAPLGVAKPPVVYLIQGFTCTSVESSDPAHSYRRMGEELVKRGIAFYRVEKAGVGDSAGTPKCSDIGYTAELEGFRAAYKHLIDARGFEPDRVFMFGHSMGGLQAPMLAAEQPPRGVAAFGTAARNWADYHQDLVAVQSYLFDGADPGKSADRAEKVRGLLRQFYFERKTPAEIAAANPQLTAELKESLSWDGGDDVWGRHYRFTQDLARQPILAAWRNTRSNVLALYGESDVVALFDTDHKLIADIANWFRPGSGRYVEVSGTEHGMTKVGDRFELREKTIAGGKPPSGEFNPQVAETVAAWVKESMARPPVRTLPERPAPAAAAN